MLSETGNLFIVKNAVNNVTDASYAQIELLVNAAKAFARSTHQGVYIIDYFKCKLLYVSDKLASWCGESSDTMTEFGYQIYTDHISKKERSMLVEFTRSSFKLFDTFPIEERLDYTVSYDFHFINGHKRTLINHHLTPLVLTSDGRIWLALCTVAMSARSTAGNLVIRKSNADINYEYSLDNHKWIVKQNIKLNEQERDVLTLSGQGYTMNEIAGMLFRSVDTIKACKRSMFARLGVKNIAEALSFTTNNKMI